MADTPTPTPTAGPRPVTIEDVHKILGAMFLELELARRENAELRAAAARNGSAA